MSNKNVLGNLVLFFCFGALKCTHCDHELATKKSL